MYLCSTIIIVVYFSIKYAFLTLFFSWHFNILSAFANVSLLLILQGRKRIKVHCTVCCTCLSSLNPNILHDHFVSLTSRIVVAASSILCCCFLQPLLLVQNGFYFRSYACMLCNVENFYSLTSLIFMLTELTPTKPLRLRRSCKRITHYPLLTM